MLAPGRFLQQQKTIALSRKQQRNLQSAIQSTRASSIAVPSELPNRCLPAHKLLEGIDFSLSNALFATEDLENGSSGESLSLVMG
jgi:hypothetical protein